MTFFDITGSFFPLTLAEADAQKPVGYSIQYFLDWHEQLIMNVTAWIARNVDSLLAGAACFVSTVLFCLALLFLIRKVMVPALEKKHKNTSQELMAVSGPVAWLVFWFGFSISVKIIPFSAEVHQTLDKMFYVCFVLSLLSILLHALQCAASLMIVRFKQKNPENYNMNKLLLDLSASIIQLIIWIFIIIFILQEVFQLKVTHLVTSAGILGLAVAFAAKDTIANIFGAFSILSGKIFQVGDWIKVGSTEGTVEQIGIRSIRIRAFNDGRQIDIPNHIIADSQVENFNKRLFWREHFCFGLAYQTTPEQMSLAKKILSDIGHDLSGLMAEGKTVEFDFLLFDQSSLNLDGFVWFKASDYRTVRHSRGLFNEEVLKRFNAAGLNMAFPTTTVLLENADKK